MNFDKLTTFLNRLEKIGFKLELSGNVPWVYVTKINGRKIKEKHASDWGFVLGYRNNIFVFEDLTVVFKLLRKYKNKPKIAFNSFEEAENELKRILESQRKITEVKPCRVYEENGKYYLTSQPKITTYKKKAP